MSEYAEVSIAKMAAILRRAARNQAARQAHRELWKAINQWPSLFDAGFPAMRQGDDLPSAWAHVSPEQFS